MTTPSKIKSWLELGIAQGYTHMLVVCDEFDNEDFPVYVPENRFVKQMESEEGSKPMQRVMEVYNLSMDLDMQLKSGKAFFY